jgi:hypothetical protein
LSLSVLPYFVSYLSFVLSSFCHVRPLYFPSHIYLVFSFILLLSFCFIFSLLLSFPRILVFVALSVIPCFFSSGLPSSIFYVIHFCFPFTFASVFFVPCWPRAVLILSESSSVSGNIKTLLK